MNMTDDQILAIANDPKTPCFLFGSNELDEWTRKHRNQHTGQCHTSSDWYVVYHRSLRPGQPDFRVLSMWKMGQVVPFSFDVPNKVAVSA